MTVLNIHSCVMLPTYFVHIFKVSVNIYLDNKYTGVDIFYPHSSSGFECSIEQ